MTGATSGAGTFYSSRANGIPLPLSSLVFSGFHVAQSLVFCVVFVVVVLFLFVRSLYGLSFFKLQLSFGSFKLFLNYTWHRPFWYGMIIWHRPFWYGMIIYYKFIQVWFYHDIFWLSRFIPFKNFPKYFILCGILNYIILTVTIYNSCYITIVASVKHKQIHVYMVHIHVFHLHISCTINKNGYGCKWTWETTQYYT